MLRLCGRWRKRRSRSDGKRTRRVGAVIAEGAQVHQRAGSLIQSRGNETSDSFAVDGTLTKHTGGSQSHDEGKGGGWPLRDVLLGPRGESERRSGFYNYKYRMIASSLTSVKGCQLHKVRPHGYFTRFDFCQ